MPSAPHLELVLQTYTVILVLTSLYSLYMFKAFPSRPKKVDAASWPKVSIVVPVKDEEDTIALCLDSLQALDYVSKEIIVVDGGSKDGTRKILQRYVPEVVVFDEGALPDGWIGKNWACHQGYLQAGGELLLFTDGDTKHSSDSLRRSVGYLVSSGADLVSIYPHLVMRGFGELLMMPLISFLIFIYCGGNKVNDDASRRYMANGQYILTRRDAYEKVGGHTAVRGKIVEDVSLAGVYKRRGSRVRVVYGLDALETRMYRSFRELWGGWVKNTYAGFNFNPAKLLGGLLAIFAAFLLPFTMLAVGMLGGDEAHRLLLVYGALGSVVVLSRMAVFYQRIGGSVKYTLLTPVASTVYLLIMITSFLKVVAAGGVVWKDRKYDLAEMRRSES